MSTKKNRPRSSAMRLLDNIIGEPLNLGGTMRSIRECEKVSQSEMAKRLGISRAHLCDIEKGRRIVSPARAAKFARELGYSETQFVRLAIQDQVTEAGLKMKVKVEAA